MRKDRMRLNGLLVALRHAKRELVEKRVENQAACETGNKLEMARTAYECDRAYLEYSRLEARLIGFCEAATTYSAMDSLEFTVIECGDDSDASYSDMWRTYWDDTEAPRVRRTWLDENGEQLTEIIDFDTPGYGW